MLVYELEDEEYIEGWSDLLQDEFDEDPEEQEDELE